ncbi:MAG: polyphosphate:AMP phosphotransferase [Defluviitaleaceae bacterium]|nr:polyphosphate:AMP phosphotransferase [Defluviitaleaceae bacterium]
MLLEINPEQRMKKDEYNEILIKHEHKLTGLQQKVRDAGLRVVIVFEGWSAAGKGTQISRLVNPLDPRYFDVRTTGTITQEKQMRPFLWSFWTYLPPSGQIVIMDKSWHRLILPQSSGAWKLSNMETHGFYFDVNAFERQLADDGYLIIKLFLHISKDEQLRRFRALSDDPSTEWRVTDQNREQNENYDKHLRAYEKMLKMTHTPHSPWTIIESNDRRFGAIKMLQTVTDAIEARLSAPSAHWAPEAHVGGNAIPRSREPFPAPQEKTQDIPRVLQSISPDETISQNEYTEQLEYYQQRMRALTNKMYAKRRAAAIVYEGWDAAGKGGSIKRLTSEADPRGYAVVPIGVPHPYELARQYLWRFMVKVPKDGHLTIFDRSWYGRVLVERVEELTPPHIWQRAYREINEFEQHLVGHGIVLLKFWLHIDKDEQLRRFESRHNDSSKSHKITEDDWRNREKWDLYEAAADEMLFRTHTPHSPWIIVESNNKKFARIKVLKTVTDALDDALK